MTGVFGFVLKERSVLLIKRGTEPYLNYWSLPGGVAGRDETLEAACKREVKEETGRDVEVRMTVDLIGNHTRDNPAFLCRYLGGDPESFPPESLAVGWIPIDKVFEMNLVPFIRKFLEDRFTFRGEM